MWIYLTEDRNASEDALRRLIRERGFGGPLDTVHVAGR